MSTLKTNNVQVGQSGTATNNFTLYQPSSPDGTVRLGVGNTGATTADVASFNSSGVFAFNSGYGSSATAYGCRAWVNFNGTGTVAIRASGNVTSITDNGTGDYTVNFTTAMSDANYSGVAISHTTVMVINTNYSVTAGSFRLTATNYSGTPTDSSIINVAVFR
jgi:hypothetical protein